MFTQMKTTRLLSFFLFPLLVISLSSCTTFFIQDNTMRINEIEHVAKQHALFDKVNETPNSGLPICQLYRLPEVESVPLLPMQTISNLGIGEHDKKINILLDYIVALRKHISKEKNIRGDHYEEYLANCKGFYMDQHRSDPVKTEMNKPNKRK